MKRTIFTLLVFAAAFYAYSADYESIMMYKPRIEGTLRAKYEYNTGLNAHRFQVRNARFSILGNFSQTVSYKAEIDLSDEGETKMLDAFVSFKPVHWFAFTIGQQKVPFSTDNLRSPYQLYFANRSFIGKQLTSLRDVGATLLLSNKQKMPFNFSVGVYNGDGLYNQQNWVKDDMSFAVRCEVFPVKNMEISLNFNSIKPENIRMNLFDAGFYVNIKHLHLESEYYHKQYQHDVFKATKGFFVFGAYDFQLKKPNLKKITPLIRFDMMTDNNKGFMDKTTSTYKVNDVARSRITSGITFSLDKPFLNDIRLNYEKYFYAKENTDNDDKIVVEAVVRF